MSAVQSNIRISRKVTPANGQFSPAGRPRVAISFDEPLFKVIRRFAKQRKISFGEAVRRLVACGLETSP